METKAGGPPVGQRTLKIKVGSSSSPLSLLIPDDGKRIAGRSMEDERHVSKPAFKVGASEEESEREKRKRMRRERKRKRREEKGKREKRKYRHREGRHDKHRHQPPSHKKQQNATSNKVGEIERPSLPIHVKSYFSSSQGRADSQTITPSEEDAVHFEEYEGPVSGNGSELVEMLDNVYGREKKSVGVHRSEFAGKDTRNLSDISQSGVQAVDLRKLYKQGDFLIAKEDIEGGEIPFIWKIDGETLLQKYALHKYKGRSIYVAKTVYAMWHLNNREMYYKTVVEPLWVPGFKTITAVDTEKGIIRFVAYDPDEDPENNNTNEKGSKDGTFLGNDRSCGSQGGTYNAASRGMGIKKGNKAAHTSEQGGPSRVKNKIRDIQKREKYVPNSSDMLEIGKTEDMSEHESYNCNKQGIGETEGCVVST